MTSLDGVTEHDAPAAAAAARSAERVRSGEQARRRRLVNVALVVGVGLLLLAASAWLATLGSGLATRQAVQMVVQTTVENLGQVLVISAVVALLLPSSLLGGGSTQDTERDTRGRSVFGSNAALVAAL